MKPAVIYGKYELQLPDGQAEWDVWSYWEQARTESILANLKRGETLYDVGTEHGSLSALYAKYGVGGGSMVLIEPSQYFWPNIRLTWWANRLQHPLACVPYFADEQTSPYVNVGIAWPPAAQSDEECPAMAYAHLKHNENARTSSVTLDHVRKATGFRPAGITIDVEGAEFRVLSGAAEVIEKDRPLIWVSIHDELAARDFGIAPGRVRALMHDLHGYEERHLGTDHEQHWLFYDPAKPVVL